MDSSTQKKNMSEYIVVDKWDRVLESGIKKMFYGAAVGMLPALVALRGGRKGFASAFVAFGAGIGIGMAYGDAKYDFYSSRTPTIVVRKQPKTEEEKREEKKIKHEIKYDFESNKTL